MKMYLGNSTLIVIDGAVILFCIFIIFGIPMTSKQLFTSISNDIVVNKIYEIRNQK